MSNKDKILDLVSEYFWLDNSSFNKFKDKLYEPKIDPRYSQYLGDDLRRRWKVPESIMEEFDGGWDIFKESFKLFIHDNDISYKDFRLNKKVINKNYIKLRKLLREYYIENYMKKLIQDIDLHGLPIDDMNREVLINRYIDDVYRAIGTKKIPSDGIDIVLSANFEDWFFCSSGESWTSCLNLESEYMYWAGLAGTIGDKNRAMLYITDGKEKNLIKGMKTERILSRSWLLLDDRDNINFVKFYPNEYLSIRNIRKITGISFKEDEWGDFRSKHPIDPIYFENGNSSFIYQDTTEFNSDLHFVGKESAGIYFFNKSNPNNIQQGDIFNHRENGLYDLIERRTDLGEEQISIHYCDDCNCAIYDEDEYHHVLDLIVCADCFDRDYYVCEQCGETHLIEDTIEIDGATRVCHNCFNERYMECEVCENFHLREEIEVVNVGMTEKLICVDCLEESEYEQCDECGRFHSAEQIEVNDLDITYCKPCLKKMIDKKQIFLFKEERSV
jgi:hypothetical protein